MIVHRRDGTNVAKIRANRHFIDGCRMRRISQGVDGHAASIVAGSPARIKIVSMQCKPRDQPAPRLIHSAHLLGRVRDAEVPRRDHTACRHIRELPGDDEVGQLATHHSRQSEMRGWWRWRRGLDVVVAVAAGSEQASCERRCEILRPGRLHECSAKRGQTLACPLVLTYLSKLAQCSLGRNWPRTSPPGNVAEWTLT